MREWHGFDRDDFRFDDFGPGARVLDVGCGTGEVLRALVERGYQAAGIDPCDKAIATLQGDGLDATLGVAEQLPYADHSLDGIVCKVVLPYTDEAKAIAEWGRVLRPGGTVRACYHGAGYYLRYLFGRGHSLARRLYGARSFVNGWCYALTGRRLPGFVGDTIYQAETRLARHYRDAGLTLVERYAGASYFGLPVFVYHVLRRRAHDVTAELHAERPPA